MTQDIPLPSDSEEPAIETLELLESRLRRIEYLVNGQSSLLSDHGGSIYESSHNLEKTIEKEEGEENTTTSSSSKKPAPSISTRLANLEHSLQKLSSKNPLVSELLRLESLHPSLFHPVPPTTIPSTLTDANLASIVLACASSFPETASRLQALNDHLPIPPATASQKLVALQPRMEEVTWRRTEQLESDIARLRERSIALLKRWLEVGIVGQGEVWTEWAERLDGLERVVGGVERRREVV